MSNKKAHELMRRDVWTRAAVAYISASNSSNKEYAGYWANAALEAFDRQFPAPIEVTPRSLKFVKVKA